jgi:hypothetical protein
MPMSGAKRQRRYRERHHDELARITLDVRPPCGIGSTALPGTLTGA